MYVLFIIYTLKEKLFYYYLPLLMFIIIKSKIQITKHFLNLSKISLFLLLKIHLKNTYNCI